MTVYHPRSWLAAMPKSPRFYPSKEALLIEHPDLPPAQIVAAQYHGPVNESTMVLHPTPNAAPLVAPLRAPVKRTTKSKKTKA